MSFFNLTELGADNPVRSSVEKRLNSGIEKDVVGGNETKTTQVPSRAPLRPKDSTTSSPNSQANGSYVKYTTMRQKHQRAPDGKY